MEHLNELVAEEGRLNHFVTGQSSSAVILAALPHHADP
jgi:hypothetical protein